MTLSTPESQIEADLITKLQDLKYTYRPDIRSREALEQNFRAHFEALNHVSLSENEWTRLGEQILKRDTFQSSKLLRERHTLIRDDGTPLDFTLVNTRDWCKNTFEVVNQLKMSTQASFQRYDVMLLLNGVPVVQIELKRELNSPRKALEQIVAYKNDKGNGYQDSLLAFIQVFVVSNRTHTFYFANNDPKHFAFNADERYLPVYTFAGPDNKAITHLNDFADHFLAKCTLAEIVSRYMVLLETEQKLLMMRPYQIYAVKNIVECIHQNTGNGYIWHTTGSGKTLTSFKASTLLRDNPDIDKCIFVVDRKDLDRQTREEFNRFQAGAVEQNSNTGALVRRLLSTDKADKVIVTTIQKLALALTGGGKKEYQGQLKPLSDKRLVFIFDECHRSQFGKNHDAIKEFFPQAQLFGFTGTPIFAANARSIQITGDKATLKTTEDIFQQELHAYTITNAIADGNVLKFKVEYYGPDAKPLKGKVKPTPSGVEPKKRDVVEAILAKHDTVTAGRKFNAILATASIDSAIAYYDLFRAAQQEKAASADPAQPYRPLNVACVFSPPPYLNTTGSNNYGDDLNQEKEDYQHEPEAKRHALERIMADYNAQYGTNHTLSEFDAYYQDVQGRIKAQQYPNKDVPHDQKIDLVIVVDMLLTGFDSKFLNTLYLDKRLVHHGLIQAMSRTNRILNDTKPYGNILDFRGQQDAVDEAITMFSGGKETSEAQETWLVEEAAAVLEKLQKAVHKVTQHMDIHDLSFTPSDVAKLKGDAAQTQFVKLFKDVQRLITQLDQYTDLTPEQIQAKAEALPNPDGFKGAYLELARKLKAQKDKPKPDPALADLDFELVLFATALIDYDYIMTLLAQSSHQPPEKQYKTREEIIRQHGADAKFIEEHEQFAEYVRGLPTDRPFTQEEMQKGFEQFKAAKNAEELEGLARTFGLDPAQLQAFVAHTLQRLVFDSEAFGELLAPLNLNWKERNRKTKEIMGDLIFVLRRRAEGKKISGLDVYEQ